MRNRTRIRVDRWPVAGRAGRIASRVAIGVLAAEAAWVLWTMAGGDARYPIACDYIALRDAAERWLAGGGFYLPSQLAGPYATTAPPGAPPIIMYPPLALWLFVPFVFLPAVLWWIVPLGLAAYGLWRLRPAPWSWPLMAALALWPRVPEAVQNGNPAMWAAAFGFLALSRGWAGPLILFKPTLAPFALLGARHRRWWIALGLVGLAVLPFGAMWVDYLAVERNSDAELWYLLHDYPLMLIPVVAWLGRGSGSHLRRERHVATQERARVGDCLLVGALPRETREPTVPRGARAGRVERLHDDEVVAVGIGIRGERV